MSDALDVFLAGFQQISGRRRTVAGPVGASDRSIDYFPAISGRYKVADLLAVMSTAIMSDDMSSNVSRYLMRWGTPVM